MAKRLDPLLILLELLPLALLLTGALVLRVAALAWPVAPLQALFLGLVGFILGGMGLYCLYLQLFGERQ